MIGYHSLLRRRSRSGFMLMELLVAVVVLGLLTGLGASILRVGLRTWSQTTKVAESANTIDVVQVFLRHEINQASPEILQSNSGNVSFDGQKDKLAFRAPLPAALGGGTPADIQVMLDDPDARSTGLVVVWSRDGGPPHKTVLLGGVSDIHFQYFGPREDTGFPAWQTSWKNRPSLPTAVRIDVDLAYGDSREWLPLTVSTMISSDAGCFTRPQGRACAGL